MKDMSYYVVEVSFRSSNPIHSAICFHQSSGNIELFGSYEGIISKNIKNLFFFNVIKEIKEMKQKTENTYKLPYNIKEEIGD